MLVLEPSIQSFPRAKRKRYTDAVPTNHLAHTMDSFMLHGDVGNEIQKLLQFTISAVN
jgi:hypothetical protein